MAEILLVRHGETEANSSDVLHGSTETGLNERGVRQAEKLAKRLSNHGFDAIFSSDLNRASKTAEIIAEHHEAPRFEREELRERDFGVFEGRKKQERRKALNQRGVDLDEFDPEQGESFDDVKSRTGKILEQIKKEHKGGKVLVVAHGWTNRSLITEALGSGKGHGKQIWQDNTCVNRLEWHESRGWLLKKLNDTGHLD